MVTKAGLYYPYIHFRDDQWIKLAALYWPSMARMVPRDYPTSDSPTVERLKADLDFVTDLRPGASAERTAKLFLGLLEAHGADLAQGLGVGHPRRDDHGWYWEGPQGRGGRIGFIFAEKLTNELVSAMASLGLAMTRPGSAHEVDRPSMMYGDATWIGMDERLAAVYMSVLADDVANAHSVSPCTDQVGLVQAVGGWSIETVAQLLLGEHLVGESTWGLRKSARETIAQLAIDMAGPIDIRQVSVDQIIRFRTAHRDELNAFRRAVEETAEDLPHIGPEMSTDVLNRYIELAVQERLDKPRRELQKALESSKIDTTLRAIGMQVTLPGLAGLSSVGVGVNPIVGVGVGAALSLATVARERSKHKSSLRAQAPAANYLIELNQTLASPELVRRMNGLSADSK